MKKIFYLIVLLGLFFLTGCGKNNQDTVFKDLTNKINKLNSYTLNGNLEIKNNNNTHTYNVKVNFMKNDKFKVALTNTSNNHEQVILRNDDGVFVLTPSLNKSFKFQSDWPYNNSQIYLLKSIVDDLNNDNTLTKSEENDKYIFISKVNYPNNNKLVKQKVTVTGDLQIEKVEVLNEKDEVEMTFTISSIDYDPTFDEAYFEVNSIINTKSNDNTNTNKENTTDKDKNNETNKEKNTETNKEENKKTETKTKETATLDDIVYPLYLPSGTVLDGQEKVSKTDGERVILTFKGEKGFTLVEETATKEKELTIIPTYGEPSFVNDTIGAMTDNSLNWISNGIEYYIVSDVMNSQELLNIASSIDVKTVMNMK